MTTIHPSIKLNQHYTRRYLALIILLLSSTLSFAQTTITWTGFVNSDWHNTGNWSPTTIPTSMESVVIPGFLSEPSPEVLSGNLAEAQSVSIAFGATLTIEGMGTLDVEKSATIGITNAGSLLIRPDGVIRVDSSGHTHIDNMASGVINNEGEIKLGSEGALLDTDIGITSSGDINNLSTGSILIEGVINDGIKLTDDAILTNDGIIDFALTTYFLGNGIVIGPNAELVNTKEINTAQIAGLSGPDLNGLLIEGEVSNQADGIININAVFSGNGINVKSTGTLINDGEIILGQSINIAMDGIISEGVFTNNGSIELGFISGSGIKNTGSMTNNNTASINTTQSINPVIFNMSTFDNYGLIDLQFGSQESITNSGNAAIFTNREDATINVNFGQISNHDSAIFNNNTCAKINLNGSFLNNTSIFNNDGFLLFENSSEQQTPGNLVNNGLIFSDPSPFPIGSITDNEIILSGPSNGNLCNSVTPVFSNSPTNLSIDNIYLDQEGTIMDGSYDPSTNTYTTSAANPFSFGNQTRYIEVSGMGANCTIIVPWVIQVTDCDCNTSLTCFSSMDKCWSPIGSDKSWSNGANWMPTGVPQTEDWVMIPTCTEIEYDYTGSDIPAVIYVNDSAKMTVLDNHILSVQARTDSKVSFYLFTNRGNVVNNGEINLSKTTRSGMSNSGTFENYGDITVDSINITNVNAPPTNVEKNGMENYRDFNNYPGSSIVIKNSLANGFRNSGNFINYSGANIRVHDITNIGMDLRFGSTFENKSDGIIDIYNINNPSDKLIIRSGAEVMWAPSVDID